MHPDDPEDPYAFRFALPGFGVTMPMVFSREPGAGTTAVHFVVPPYGQPGPPYGQPGLPPPLRPGLFKRRWSNAAIVGVVAIPLAVLCLIFGVVGAQPGAGDDAGYVRVAFSAGSGVGVESAGPG